ncbi:hypothetical protein MRX96_057851 [Rhipicephalus microplus]
MTTFTWAPSTKTAEKLFYDECCTARIAWLRYCIHSSFTVQHQATTLQFFQCLLDIQMGIPFWSIRRHSDPGELHHTTLPGPPCQRIQSTSTNKKRGH